MASNQFWAGANGGSPKHHIRSKKFQRKQLKPSNKMRLSSNIVGKNVAAHGGSYKAGLRPGHGGQMGVKKLPKAYRGTSFAAGRRGQTSGLKHAAVGGGIAVGGATAVVGGRKVIAGIKRKRATGSFRQRRDSHGRFA